ncbi:MAG: YaaC family protein [Candidatus Heimdallarchaeaceae archaeon]
MNTSLIGRAINGLKIASIQYQHEEYLKKRFQQKEKNTFYAIDKPRYEAKLRYYFGIRNNSDAIKKQLEKLNLEEKIEDTIKVRVLEENNISAVAQTASLYFQQALEMYQTSLNMPENTSPLVEYYALLQCVKGSIILDLHIEEGIFFRFHGIVHSSNKENEYIRAKIKPLGVFSALAIRFAHFIEQKNEEGEIIYCKNDLEDYYKEDFSISLKEIVKPPPSSTYDNSHHNPLSIFIGAWMLSTLVRYVPKKWQEILAGQKNDLIYNIRYFREEEIPRTFESCLPNHIRMLIGRRPS